MQLSWQPGFSLSRRPIKRSAARRTKRGTSTNVDRAQQFEFVVERPVRNSRARHSPSVATSTHSRILSGPIADGQANADPKKIGLFIAGCPINKHPARTDVHGAHSQAEARKESEPCEIPLSVSRGKSLISSADTFDPKTICRSTDARLSNRGDQCISLSLPELEIDQQLLIPEGSYISCSTTREGLWQVAAYEPSNAAASILSGNRSATIPPAVLYSDLSQRFMPILDRCMFALHPFCSARLS